MILSIILFLVIIAVLVLVHEFGHFIVAKKSGIRVDEFGLGFPPRVYGKRFGETTYTLNALPFGGFVKIFGEDPDHESLSGPDSERSFAHQPHIVQAAVIVAGVAMNAILAWALLSFGFMIGMPLPADEYPGAQVTDAKLVITDVTPGSPAEMAKLEPGDEIVDLASGDKTLTDMTPAAVQQFILSVGKNAMTFDYKRGGVEDKTVMTPADGVVPGRPAIGIEMDTIGTVRLGIGRSLIEGAKLTWGLTQLIASAFWGLVSDAFHGHADIASLSGPVGIVTIIGEQAKLGFIYVLTLVAMISINLAIINLIPVPGLDGGRLLFVIIEAITRRAINPKITNTANTVGFGLLVLLLIFITYHDVAKLIS